MMLMAPTTSGEGYAPSNKNLVKALMRHVNAIERSVPRRQAIGWVFATVASAWAEDHGLIGQHLRAGATSRRR